MSFIGHRYAKANNKYVGEYDESKPTSFLSYFDANNLYGAAMIKKLPTGGYRWSRMTAEELLAVDADGDIGNLVEVDLEYPKELHATHSMYPLAPVRRRILAEELSPYSASFGVESKVEKLVTTLEDKKHYVCHIKNLQQYCKLGMKITAVHRVIEFEQAAWLAPYIEFNTKKRTATKDDFEKDFYKLMNNAVFGKTMENVRNRKAMKFFDTQDKRIQKYTARPTYGGIFHNIGDRMVALEIQSSEVSMDKPIAVGITVLELSKTIMYNFHYNIMIPRYGANNLKLCMTDTDSLFYHIQCEDVYRDMSELRQHFDLSDFPKDHPCYDATNKKVIGKFKDESSEHAIQEFVGLRSKLYAYKTADKESKRCKGISKEVVKKDICFNDYYYTLMSGTSLSKNVRGIVSKDHKLITYETKKSALAAFDDKRFYLNNIESVPYGY